MRASSLTIKLDAGHGAEDPGVVDSGRKMLEKNANLETVLTLKYLLNQAGINVVMSRTDDSRPSYANRVKDEGQQLLIAVHYNMLGSYPCIYYQHNRPRSRAFANTLSWTTGIPDAKVWDTSTEHRWGRLYIDDSVPVAVLWEVDAIGAYRDERAYRLAKCLPVVKAVKGFFDVK